MNRDEAVRLLSRLREAAPPATAARLSDVIDFVAELDSTPAENSGSQRRILTPEASQLSLTTIMDHLNGTMQSIEAQASSLRAGRLGRVTTEQADALKLVVEYASNGGNFVSMIRQWSQIRSGDFTLNALVFNPLDAAAEAWQRTFSLADTRDHQFTIMADDPLPLARGDYQQVLNILIGLVDNAIHYTPFGGDIRLSVNTLGTHLLFNVADSGIGLTAEDLLHVGEPFWRGLHQPLVKHHPGSGLRLYLSREILCLMGGELIFSGEPGIGSTFSFTLPADLN